LLGDGSDPSYYGNYDLGNRPEQQKIDYIVIHDTEGSYDSSVSWAQDPTGIGWHYTVRSSDGYVAQHVKTKDVGWQAGNWYVNYKSIGIEHEGYAAQGTWFTEAMYRHSARLVRYLADRFGVPLDRQHIIGHDNVPGPNAANVQAMHWDPGPYWDWNRYFRLLGAPLPTKSTGTAIVTIKPNFSTNQPAYTGCEDQTASSETPCPLRGSSEVILRTEPRADASLISDIGLHPDGAASTMLVSEYGARASTGQSYAVADRSGDWTAIWYLGQKAWFYNPASAPTAVGTTGQIVVPKSGKTSISVYGRAYPEASAYPAGVSAPAVVALPYTITTGQRYTVGGIVTSEYYGATTFDGSAPLDWQVIRGSTKYVQIQLGHRFMFVNLDDVDIITA
jgi:hypothetical protein